MPQSLIVTVDIATSGVKAAAYQEDGRKVGHAKSEYRLSTPQPGYAEQDADDILTAVFAVLRRLISGLPTPRCVRALSLGGVMHSVLGVSSDGRALTPLVTWADTRSSEETARARAAFELSLYQRTGVPTHAMLPLTKIAWFARNCPDLHHAIRRYVSIKEYVTWHLTGQWVVDISTAASSGLYQVTSTRWDEEALTFAGTSPQALSDLSSCTASFPLTQAACARIGIAAAVPVIIGSTDGILANVGSGATAEGDVAVTFGSSGAVRRMVPTVELDPLGRTFCYPLARDWFVVGGASNSGGIVWNWLLEQFPPHPDAPPDEQRATVWQAISAVEPGAGGLTFLPYLAGERAPIWNPSARGALLGLTLQHGRAHMWRAGAEGMAFALASIYRLIAALGPAPQRVVASGGFFQEPVWRALCSSVLGIPMVLGTDADASLRGSFLLALAGLEGESLQRVAASFAPTFTSATDPDEAQARLYADLVDRFIATYDQIKPCL